MSSLPLNAAPAKLCALYPHLKDSYWLSVNAGMVEQAQALGVELKTFEAGGYEHQATQIEQFQKCRDWGADAVLLGSVTYELPTLIRDAMVALPVLALVNQVEPDTVVSTIGVEWYAMGESVALYVNDHFTAPTRTLLMFGPKGQGGNQFLSQGLTDHLKPGLLAIEATLHGSNSVARQRQLLVEYLASHPAPDLIIAGAIPAEVAVNEIQARGLKTRVISTYLSHGVYRALLRNKIEMANSDRMRLQGRMAVDAALAHLKGETLPARLDPGIEVLKPPKALGRFEDSLSDPDFRPVYDVTVVPNR
ncbi:TMAO reductase system periplasmic protein TorT [Ferrimonas balearica]|uniref:TMAO reductase system periplasmic protein TorT n=1 Tax=Ferrimonas balearica TaxID=44012 RepID=UPI001C98F1A1|nr:TMAO reductase system periplasmic protein TorT [Ferrimonas balearica]MBY5922295.1 TMAO reductase system periplasmic protein TorT [Ferrimonas balearica]MBY5994365.1 TMAO reductase system periplasmic protein TorT [Ferrimonas balearica]